MRRTVRIVVTLVMPDLTVRLHRLLARSAVRLDAVPAIDGGRQGQYKKHRTETNKATVTGNLNKLFAQDGEDHATRSSCMWLK